jgi:hypothetical protein
MVPAAKILVRKRTQANRLSSFIFIENNPVFF